MVAGPHLSFLSISSTDGRCWLVSKMRINFSSNNLCSQYARNHEPPFSLSKCIIRDPVLCYSAQGRWCSLFSPLAGQSHQQQEASPQVPLPARPQRVLFSSLCGVSIGLQQNFLNQNLFSPIKRISVPDVGLSWAACGHVISKLAHAQFLHREPIKMEYVLIIIITHDEY